MTLRRGLSLALGYRLLRRLGPALPLSLIAAAPVPTQPEPAPTGALRYMSPPAPIGRILAAPARPLVVASPNGETLALLSRPGLPSIAELAQPELRLAGLTVDPRNGGPAGTVVYDGLVFQPLASGGSARAVPLAEGARIVMPLWSPDGSHLAFLMLRDETVELWTAQAATGRATRLAAGVSAGFGRPFEWLPDSSGLLVRLVAAGRGAPPLAQQVPASPIVRESVDRVAAVSTLPNLLASPDDEALFEYHFTSRLARVGLDGAAPRPIGEAGIVAEASVSPDGRYILQHRLKRPFSYAVTAASFPTEILVTDLAGRIVRRIADRPALAGPAAVPGGPRAVQWRADAPAALFWAESRPGGGDRMLILPAPFERQPRLLAEIGQRFQSIHWGRGDFALAIATSPTERREYRYALAPDVPGATQLLQTRDHRGGEEAGRPMTRDGPGGGDVLRFTSDGTGLLMRTPGGLARLGLVGGAPRSLWRKAPGESLFEVLDAGAERLLVWRESATEPPNLFLFDRRRPDASARKVSDFTDPAPELAGIRTRPFAYRRADGSQLRGTLHLPAGYDSQHDGPLPVLLWAYPYVRTIAADSERCAPADDEPTRAAASPRFVRPTGTNLLPFLLLTQGYALLEADMPVIGTESAPPLDSYVAQIVANAEAAVDALVAHGIAERGRIAVGGHSFGAAMAASLLAHSDLFRTGIAMSGAYNRTLTPFGFQATERRSFWDAPDAYLAMSPFVHADRIDEPLLLVHGATDANSGTWPMQSERLYEAISGNGGTVRYVLLPHEGHHYRARESLGHVMWEVTRWLEAHLRPGTPRSERE